LVERFNGIEEVSGSNPLCSTIFFGLEIFEQAVSCGLRARPSSTHQPLLHPKKGDAGFPACTVCGFAPDLPRLPQRLLRSGITDPGYSTARHSP